MPHEAAIIEQYQANKYQPRGPVVYCASLYADPPFDAATAACACGHKDPLHVRDACGRMVIDADSAATMRAMQGYGVFRAELDGRSCSANKARLTTGPQAWVHEVDALTAPPRLSSSPNHDSLNGQTSAAVPSARYNLGFGQQTHLAFEDWLTAKQERAVLEEAQRKRRAVAELSAQVERRAQAQQAFQAWVAAKQQQQQQQGAASSATQQPTSTPSRPATATASSSSSLEAAARREAMFALWRASKDAAHLAALRAEQEQSARAAEAAETSRLEAVKRGAEAHAKWLAEHEEVRAASLERKRAEKAGRREAKEQEKRTKATKSAEQVAAWLAAKKDAVVTRRPALEEQQRAEREARAKRAAEVEATRPAREQRLADHLHVIEQQRRQQEAKEVKRQRRQHKLAWRKKDDPLAYSTHRSTAHVFR